MNPVSRGMYLDGQTRLNFILYIQRSDFSLQTLNQSEIYENRPILLPKTDLALSAVQIPK